MPNTHYLPKTATPFKHNDQYKETLPRNPELAKYVRCFWGSEIPYVKVERNTFSTVEGKAFSTVERKTFSAVERKTFSIDDRKAFSTNIDNISESLVIPDTCVDIIYHIDYTENTITGGFCGINDASFIDHDSKGMGHLISTFAIRFYAWGAYAFSEDSLSDTLNGYYDVQSVFCRLDKILREQLFEINSLKERAEIAEKILLCQLSRPRENNIINSAINRILLQKGVISTTALAKDCFVSSRQIERLFNEYIGITPKKLCNLVRYQFLWNEIISNPKFNILEAVYKYGYTDQSHLMREFKRYHSMSIGEAKMYAYNNVGNIQYFHGKS